jgi:hypothetical protein
LAVVVVNDLHDVTVDGVPAGAVTDVLANYKAVPGIRSEVLRAVQAWIGLRTMAQKQALAERDGRIVELEAQVVELEAQVAALGGIPRAVRLRMEARRKAALEARAAAEAELEALDRAEVETVELEEDARSNGGLR